MAKQICLPILLIILLFLPKTSFADSGVVINEITPTPSSGSDWVELYNSSDADVDISNWVLDDEGTSSEMLIIPQNTILAQKSAKLFYVSNRLNKDGDTVYLKNQGIEVDKYQYTSTETDVSFARFPDGSSIWANCTPTPQAANANCQIPPSPSPEIIAQSPPLQPSSSPVTSSQATKPKTSPSPSGAKSVTSSNSPKPQVLGQKLQSSPQILNQGQFSPSPSTQGKDNQKESLNKVKLATLFAGSGLVTIGGATGAYLWYHKNNKEKNQQKESLY